MNNRPLIEIRDLRKIYRFGEVDVPALRGVNLDAAGGEFLSDAGHLRQRAGRRAGD